MEYGFQWTSGIIAALCAPGLGHSANWNLLPCRSEHLKATSQPRLESSLDWVFFPAGCLFHTMGRANYSLLNHPMLKQKNLNTSLFHSAEGLPYLIALPFAVAGGRSLGLGGRGGYWRGRRSPAVAPLEISACFPLRMPCSESLL